MMKAPSSKVAVLPVPCRAASTTNAGAADLFRSTPPLQRCAPAVPRLDRGPRLRHDAAMRLTAAQLEQFNRDGILVLPDLFSPAEVAVLRAALPAVFAEDTPANFREKDGSKVRTAMGIHLRSHVFAKLVCHPRFVEPAQQILGDDALYVMQAKVNVKAAFGGDVWQWHYDFATHHHEDGIPRPQPLNLHVFLDDVSEFNGPLWFI